MPYDFFDDIQMAITFEFDRTLYEMERTAYNVLDWIGDIGGLLEALLVFFAGFIALAQPKTFENFMVQKLFSADEDA